MSRSSSMNLESSCMAWPFRVPAGCRTCTKSKTFQDYGLGESSRAVRFEYHCFSGQFVSPGRSQHASAYMSASRGTSKCHFSIQLHLVLCQGC